MARQDSPAKDRHSRWQRYRLAAPRLAGIDQARGLALVIAVVLEGITAGAPHDGSLAARIASFIAPFALPAFLFIAGLYAPRSLALAWPTFATRRLGPFAIAYALSAAAILIASAVVASHMPGLSFAQVALTLAAPFATLQLLWLVPLCLVIFRLTSGLRPVFVIAVAALALLARNHVGPPFVGAAFGAFLYFYLGAWLAPRVLAIVQAPWPPAHVILTLLAAWAALEYFLVSGPVILAGVGAAELPFVDIALALAGVAAVLAAAQLTAVLPRSDLTRALGRHWVGAYPALLAGFALAGPPLLGLLALFGRLPLPVTTGTTVALLVLFAGLLAEQFWAGRRHAPARKTETSEA